MPDEQQYPRNWPYASRNLCLFMCLLVTHLSRPLTNGSARLLDPKYKGVKHQPMSEPKLASSYCYKKWALSPHQPARTKVHEKINNGQAYAKRVQSVGGGVGWLTRSNGNCHTKCVRWGYELVSEVRNRIISVRAVMRQWRWITSGKQDHPTSSLALTWMTHGLKTWMTASQRTGWGTSHPP